MNPSQEELFNCPYCGAENSILVDFSGPSRQQFVHDCEICCRPIVVQVRFRGQEIIDFQVQGENE